MKLRGDFHCHMNGNGPENNWPNVKMLAEYAVALGYNAIMLGCHDWVCPKDLARRCEEEYGLIVVRSAEITTDGGHMLAYNIPGLPSACRSANQHNPMDIWKAIDAVHNIGGKCVMAHPYPVNDRWRWPNKFAEVVELLDGAELRNYKSKLRHDLEFTYVLDYQHLKLFSNSDCHPWEGDLMHGDYCTEIDSEWFGELQ